MIATAPVSLNFGKTATAANLDKDCDLDKDLDKDLDLDFDLDRDLDLDLDYSPSFKAVA